MRWRSPPRATPELPCPQSPPYPTYSLGEEIANAVTHGLGVVLAIAGLAVMSAFAALYGDAWHITACAIFGASLIFCYATSTLYHSIQIEKVRRVLRTLDHSAIFLLIAGTYTPFMLVSLRGPGDGRCWWPSGPWRWRESPCACCCAAGCTGW
jgi:hemolysin III